MVGNLGNSKPNIVFVVLDTVSAFHLPFHGYERDTAPFLTDLADENLLFRFAYSNSPWTIPSHASIFSGKLPSESGVNGENLYFSEYSFVQDLSFRGYQTVGISHNGLISEETGFDNGFDELISGPNQIHYQFSGLKSYRRLLNKDYENKFSKYTDFIKGLIVHKDPQSVFKVIEERINSSFGLEIDLIGERTVEEINGLVERKLKDINDPVFLFLNYNEAHLDYDPPVEFAEEFIEEPQEAINNHLESYQENLDFRWREMEKGLTEDAKKLYDAEIKYLDTKLKDLKDIVEKEIGSDTVFIFVSDHGEMIGEYGMRGHNCGIWEKLIRVPFIVAGSEVRNDEIRKNVSLKNMEEFIRTGKIDDLTQEKVRSEYFGYSKILEGRNIDFDLKSEYVRNKSDCLVNGREGLIKNSHLPNRGFLGKNFGFTEPNQIDEISFDFDSEVC